MKKVTLLCIILLFLDSSHSIAEAPDYTQLDPKPYDPQTDPNIDMFISHWKESTPRHTYGQLIERDIFTPLEGNPLRPTARGAVLEYINRFTYATLEENKSTTPTTLKAKQVIFYINAGKGTVRTSKKTANLRGGVCVLIPMGIEFTMTNTGDEPLTMYVIAEPVPPDFKPGKEMIVRDENEIPISTTQSHWSHILRVLFYEDEALATLIGISPVWFDPMTMGQPHSHSEGEEEIWFVVRGDVHVLLGKQLRKLSPGSAFKVPPDGNTPHSTINVSENEQVKLVWFMRVPR